MGTDSKVRRVRLVGVTAMTGVVLAGLLASPARKPQLQPGSAADRGALASGPRR